MKLHPSLPPHDLIFYVISREEIEAGDTSRFIRDFLPSFEVEPAVLLSSMGRVVFSVAGYDEHQEEVFSIPEIRNFFQKIHQQWPCWLFYSELASPGLTAIIYSILPWLSVQKSSGSPRMTISHKPEDLGNFLKDCAAPLERLSDLAGLTDAQVEQRTDQIITYIRKWFEGR